MSRLSAKKLNRPPGMSRKLTSGEILLGRHLLFERRNSLYKYIPGQSKAELIPTHPEMEEFEYDKQAKISYVDEQGMACLATMGRWKEDHQWYVLGMQLAGTNYIGPMGIPELDKQIMIDDSAHEKLLALQECTNVCTTNELKGDCLELAEALFTSTGVGIVRHESATPEERYIIREMNVRHPRLNWGEAFMNTVRDTK